MPFIFHEAILKVGAFPLGDLDVEEKSVAFTVSDMDIRAFSFGLGSSSADDSAFLFCVFFGLGVYAGG